MKIYIDENFPPQLAKGLNILEQPNSEGVEVLSIKEVFKEGIADEEWIPKVGTEKGIVITQDCKIQRTRHQKELYEKNNIGVFFFKPPSNKGYKYWEMVEQIIKRWNEIKKLCKTPRPFVFRCTSRADFESLD